MALNRESYFNKSRVEALSDGIFAVSITLLVLGIRVPEIHNHQSMSELAKALLTLIPKLLSWIISFLIVCVIWVNHHHIFKQLKIVTKSIFWFNANLLLWSTLIPFPTALMGDYVNNPLSLITFGIINLLLSFSFYFLRKNIIKNDFVLKENVDRTHYKNATRKLLIFGPILYVLGILSSLIHPYIAFTIYFFIPFYFVFFSSSKLKED